MCMVTRGHFFLGAARGQGHEGSAPAPALAPPTFSIRGDVGVISYATVSVPVYSGKALPLSIRTEIIQSVSQTSIQNLAPIRSTNHRVTCLLS